METEWIELDVRPMLAAGREPFALIMNHLGTLERGQGLRLLAPFFPKPLVDMLQNQGWQADSRGLEGAGFEVCIRRVEAGNPGPDLELDLRQFAPPEPMVRILESLESLGEGQRLVALTPFYPENLFPILDERGFGWKVERESGQTCRVTITRA